MSLDMSKHFLIDRELVKCIVNGQADWAKTLYRMKTKHFRLLDESETKLWNDMVYHHSFNILFRISVFDTGISADRIDAIYKKNLNLISQKAFLHDSLGLMERIIDNYCDLVNSQKGHNFSEVISKAYDLIHGDLSADLRLKSISHKLSISSSHLSRLFHKEVGLPFNQYVRNIRIEKAKSLLKKSSFSIGEIASYCGYTDPSYFHNVFKAATKFTPNEYRSSQEISLRASTQENYSPENMY